MNKKIRMKPVKIQERDWRHELEFVYGISREKIELLERMGYVGNLRKEREEKKREEEEVAARLEEELQLQLRLRKIRTKRQVLLFLAFLLLSLLDFMLYTSLEKENDVIKELNTQILAKRKYIHNYHVEKYYKLILKKRELEKEKLKREEFIRDYYEPR